METVSAFFYQRNVSRSGISFMKAKEAKKKYKPQILNTFKYRGYTLRERFNRKTNRREFISRFQLNNKEFNPVADSRKDLEEIIDDLIYNERRAKNNLSTETIDNAPYLREVFEENLARLVKPKSQTDAARIFNDLLELLPEDIRITEFGEAHFQLYIDKRLKDTNKASQDYVKPQSINRERTYVTKALSSAKLYFPNWTDAKNYKKPDLPKAEGATEIKRERLVDKDTELNVLLAHLREKQPKQADSYYFSRARLADRLEFNYETGFRRKEIAGLKKSQYYPNLQALKTVKRFKTGTKTRYFPLSTRAKEIIESRIALQADSEFIFSPDGKPIESEYRTLKKVCAELNIAYGKYTDGGFVAHDLRHNFATEIIPKTDPQSAAELMGVSNLNQIMTYIHSNPQRLREAIDRRENRDIKKDLIAVYKNVKRGKIKAREFVEKILNLAKK